MKYFTMEELTGSRTARRLGIDNEAPAVVEARLEQLVEWILDPVRELWGAPIEVNSGYRSPELNAAVNGAVNSQHMLGEAADITTGSREGNRRLFNIIGASGLDFDQLIDEKNYSWLHISWCGEGNRQQILHL
jgi:hypothetical protein